MMMFVQLGLQYYMRHLLTHLWGTPTYKRGNLVATNKTSNEDLQVSPNNDFISCLFIISSLDDDDEGI